MKKGLVLWMMVALLPASIFANEARKIMEKNDALTEPRSSSGSSIMVIVRGGSQEKKVFTSVSKKYGKKSRARITFTSPTRIEFLTWSQPGKDSLQWIKLSGGSVRKIASSDKNGSFVNSHFFYEDIGDRDIDDYRYKLLGSAKVGKDNVYKIESVKKKGSKVYSKSILYIRKSDYVLRRADFYEKGRLTKILHNEAIQKIQGIYTPRKIIMQRADGSGKSILYLKKIKYNIGVSDASLTVEAL